MRGMFFALILASTFLFGCEKDDNTQTQQSKTELLTGKVWVYDEYFTNYGTSTQASVYKRGSNQNTLDLSKNRAIFKKDGNVEEVNQHGQSFSGTWRFLNNETQIEVKNSVGTFVSDLKVLNNEKYEWHDLNAKTYGKLVQL